MPPAHRTVSLNSAGHPIIHIKVWGIHEQFAQEFDALLDTGFTGFLMLPLTAALPLGLTLISTTSYTLADGTSTTSLLALGTIDYEGQQIFGPISLESNVNCKDVLVGMEFIKQGKLMLMLHAEGAILLDLEAMKQLAESQSQATGVPATATPPAAAAEQTTTPPTAEVEISDKRKPN